MGKKLLNLNKKEKEREKNLSRSSIRFYGRDLMNGLHLIIKTREGSS